MGDKRPSIRTLPSGEKIQHFPPSELHPDGKKVLIRDCSVIGERVKAKRAAHQERHQEIRDGHQDRIDFKKITQRAKGMPHEKSPI